MNAFLTLAAARATTAVDARFVAVGPVKPPGMGGLTQLVGWTMWIVVFLCVLAFIGGIAYLVIGMIEGREIHGVKIVGIALFGAIVVGSAGTYIATLTGVTVV